MFDIVNVLSKSTLMVSDNCVYICI